MEIHSFREGYSSHLDVVDLSNKSVFYQYINNQKIININNFNLKTKYNKINFSTFYTNPFELNSKILSKISFYYTKYKTKTFHIDMIFKNIYKLKPLDWKFIIKIVKNKKFNHKNFISLEETFLIMLYLIKIDDKIKNKYYYLILLKKYWNKFKKGIFSPLDIIDNIVILLNHSKYPDNQINYQDPIITKKIKFYTSFYILCEEFHCKYIIEWLKIYNYIPPNYYKNYYTKFIFNSSYTMLNPQEILNNCFGRYNFNLENILEQLQIPPGHNLLFLFDCDKVYYYDPDKTIYSDLIKLSKFFRILGLKFNNISNRKPIQTITNDNYCLFYCLRMAQMLVNYNIGLSLDKLKNFILQFEKQILIFDDMHQWIIRNI